MDTDRLFDRYRELQSYVGWTDEDARRVAAVAPLLEPHLPALIDDFYAEIERHPEARKVITGGQAQIDRLKGTLLQLAPRAARRPLRRATTSPAAGGSAGGTSRSASTRSTPTSPCRGCGPGLVRALQETLAGRPRDAAGDGPRRSTSCSTSTWRSSRTPTRPSTPPGSSAASGWRRIGQVAGGVAHELRNPLNVVKTSVYYLLNARNPTPEKKAEHLRRIERHVELADGVITALSNFARMPVPNLQPVPGRAAACARRWRSTRRATASRSRSTVPPSLPPALADADQVRIVFGNLIRNAREAMPQGGRLTDHRPADGGRASRWPSPTRASASRRSDLARIMEPLYSTKARGLGLGLAIARAILEKNQGSLRVASEPGEGSTFTVRLTAAPARRSASHERPRRASDPRRGRRRGHLPQPVRHPHRPGLPGRRRPRRAVRPGAGAAAALRRRPARPEDAGHGRPDALPRDQEAARRDGGASWSPPTPAAPRPRRRWRPGPGRSLPKPVDFPRLLGLVDEALGQPLVLVVDDDRDLCANLWDLLRERGYRVGLAHDAARGGRAARGHDVPGRPDRHEAARRRRRRASSGWSARPTRRRGPC